MSLLQLEDGWMVSLLASMGCQAHPGLLERGSPFSSMLFLHIFTLFPKFFSVTVLDSSLQVNKHDAGVCLGPPGIVLSVKKLSDRALTVFNQTQFSLLLQRFTLDGKF